MSSSYHVMNICDAKEIPYINTYMDKNAASNLAALNMYPSEESLIQILIDVVNATQSKSLTILYESPLWLNRVTKLLEFNNKFGRKISIRNLDYNTNSEFRPVLQEIRDSDDQNIILECSIEPLSTILKQVSNLS